MSGIVLEQVSRAFSGGVQAVDELSLSVSRGECVALLGPSGCGKTTTLRLIAGLESPFTGTIRLAGRDVRDVPARQRSVSLVSQEAVLFPHWSIERNLTERWAALQQSVAVVRPDYFQRVMDLLELSSLLPRYPGDVSGGERQRIALGRLLLGPAEFFLLDEPLSKLDTGRRVELRGIVPAFIRERGATTVWVTHDQAEALAVGDRVGVMRAGRIEQVAGPRELYANPMTRFVAEFVGEPRMNVTSVRTVVRDGVLKLAWGGREWPFPSEWKSEIGNEAGRDWLLGVRPEDVTLSSEPEANQGQASRVSGVAMVKGVQFLGARTTILVTGAGKNATEEWRVSVRDGEGLRPGEEIRLSFSLRQALWFDPTTGRNVRRKEA